MTVVRRIAATALRAVLSSLVAALPAVALAQAFPSKPVRILVPYPAGGTTDIVVHLESGDSVTRHVRVELDKWRRIIQNQRLLKPSPNRQQNT